MTHSNNVFISQIYILFAVLGFTTLFIVFDSDSQRYEEHIQMKCYDKIVDSEREYNKYLIIFTDSSGTAYEYYTNEVSDYTKVEKNNIYNITTRTYERGDTEKKVWAIGEKVNTMW